MGRWLECGFEPRSEEGRRALRRLNRWMLGFAIVSAAMTLGAAILMTSMSESSPWLRGAIALLPLAPLAAMFYVLGKTFCYLDEMVIRIQFQALALTVGLTIFISTAWGQLQLAELLPLTAMSMLWPLVVVVYVACLFVVKRRYR